MNTRLVAVIVMVIVAASIAIVAGPSIDVLEPYELTPGTRATLEIKVTERLRSDDASPWRMADVLLRGPVAEGHEQRWPIVAVGYESVDTEGNRVFLDTAGPASDPLARTGAETVRVALMEQLMDHVVAVEIDLREGLVSLKGLDAALDAAGSGLEARADVIETERASLRSLLNDAAVLAGLRAAGLGQVTAEVTDQLLDVRREARFPVPGRGFATMQLVGYQGETRDRGHAVRFRGTLTDDERFEENTADVVPPQGVGDAIVANVAGSGETEYLAKSMRPLRGLFKMTVPYRQGYQVTRQTEYVLIADEPR